MSEEFGEVLIIFMAMGITFSFTLTTVSSSRTLPTREKSRLPSSKAIPLSVRVCRNTQRIHKIVLNQFPPLLLAIPLWVLGLKLAVGRLEEYKPFSRELKHDPSNFR